MLNELVLNIKKILRVPKGTDVRHLVILFTFFVTLGRFGLTQLTSPGSAIKINIISSWQYGTVFLVLFIALLLTHGKYRLTIYGFLVDIVGCGLYILHAIDVWPVFPSAINYGLMALVLLGESVTTARILHDNN